jgi:hypothetical protein
MGPVRTDNSDSDAWTEEELNLLKTLVELKIPMHIICNQLDRSWTASVLKAIDLELDYDLCKPIRYTPSRRPMKETRN